MPPADVAEMQAELVQLGTNCLNELEVAKVDLCVEGSIRAAAAHIENAYNYLEDANELAAEVEA